jgi:hypothetical protein
MSPERLTEIRRRLDAVTPGPWIVDIEVDGVYARKKTVVRSQLYQTRIVTVGQTRQHRREECEANVELIANAPNDIADLLAEVERLREAYSKMRDAAKVYYTISKNETYIREEDLPPIFHQDTAPLPGGEVKNG